MTWSFGDSFDLYAATSDMLNGYWDSSGAILNGVALTAGRFVGSQGLSIGRSNGFGIVKTSGVNDAVHHLVFSFMQEGGVSGSTLGLALTLQDGSTSQCSVVFRQDGAILLTSGGGGGSTLATYTGAFTTTGVWYAFEIEIVVNNTTGSFKVRKNGATSDSFSATGLNTRGGTANNYANRLNIIIQSITSNNHDVDDLFWQSGATAGTWLGDIRCYARMPLADISVMFSKNPTSLTQTIAGVSSTNGIGAGSPRYTPFTAAYGGPLTGAIINTFTGYTGNLKCSLFADSAGAPGAVLSSATPIANPVSGNNTLIFSTPVTIVHGTNYWLGVCSDTSSGSWGTGGGGSGVGSTTAYASFPVASPTVTTGFSVIACGVIVGVGSNASLVAEPQQDGLTTYVYDSNPGDADFYSIGSIGVVPAAVIATTVRAYMQKSDANPRTAVVQLRSGSGPPSTTWNPADLSGVTLTNGRLTATASGGVGGIRAIKSNSSGKYYWEASWSIASNTLGNGLSLSTASLTVPATGSTKVQRLDSHIYVNGVDTGNSINSGSAIPNSSVIGMAVDFSAQLIWYRLAPSGNWNGSGTANPAAGVGGISISAIAGALFPMMLGQGGDIVTANFGGSAFSGAVPAGFSAWDAGTSTVASPTLTLSNSTWNWAWRTDLTDPNTGVVWTPAAVDNVQIGPKVIA